MASHTELNTTTPEKDATAMLLHDKIKHCRIDGAPESGEGADIASQLHHEIATLRSKQSDAEKLLAAEKAIWQKEKRDILEEKVNLQKENKDLVEENRRLAGSEKTLQDINEDCLLLIAQYLDRPGWWKNKLALAEALEGKELDGIIMGKPGSFLWKELVFAGEKGVDLGIFVSSVLSRVEPFVEKLTLDTTCDDYRLRLAEEFAEKNDRKINEVLNDAQFPRYFEGMLVKLFESMPSMLMLQSLCLRPGGRQYEFKGPVHAKILKIISAKLPNLKTLTLPSWLMVNDEMLQVLTSSCPKLEESGVRYDARSSQQNQWLLAFLNSKTQLRSYPVVDEEEDIDEFTDIWSDEAVSALIKRNPELEVIFVNCLDPLSNGGFTEVNTLSKLRSLDLCLFSDNFTTAILRSLQPEKLRWLYFLRIENQNIKDTLLRADVNEVQGKFPKCKFLFRHINIIDVGLGPPIVFPDIEEDEGPRIGGNDIAQAPDPELDGVNCAQHDVIGPSDDECSSDGSNTEGRDLRAPALNEWSEEQRMTEGDPLLDDSDSTSFDHNDPGGMEKTAKFGPVVSKFTAERVTTDEALNPGQKRGPSAELGTGGSSSAEPIYGHIPARGPRSIPARASMSGLTPHGEPCDVTVAREKEEGFGFVIISNVNRSGAAIGKIIPGSPAHCCGYLRVGDRIIAVNGQSILNMHHADIVNLIKMSGKEVILTVAAEAYDDCFDEKSDDPISQGPGVLSESCSGTSTVAGPSRKLGTTTEDLDANVKLDGAPTQLEDNENAGSRVHALVNFFNSCVARTLGSTASNDD